MTVRCVFATFPSVCFDNINMFKASIDILSMIHHSEIFFKYTRHSTIICYMFYLNTCVVYLVRPTSKPILLHILIIKGLLYPTVLSHVDGDPDTMNALQICGKVRNIALNAVNND